MSDERAWAERVVLGPKLADKLIAPPATSTIEPHPSLRIPAPGRSPGIQIVPGRAARVPPLAGMSDPAQRARILHALANHELQAIELFAWAVLAFADAPPAFRRGLVAIAADEQRHFELYRARLAAHGVEFGAYPMTGHFWGKLDHMRTPLEFVCAMGLTFEAANLDFARDYAEAARRCGDHATADVLARVHDDEIRHVHFGWMWLRRFAGDDDAWTTYRSNIRPPLGPHRARGARFDREARRRAGFDDEFIAQLDAIAPMRPSGAPR